jgi:hypothetical protein
MADTYPTSYANVNWEVRVSNYSVVTARARSNASWTYVEVGVGLYEKCQLKCFIAYCSEEISLTMFVTGRT